MKIMEQLSKSILWGTLLFLVTITLNAQDGTFKNSTPEERAEFQTEWMKTELSLDSTVVPTVYDINLKYSKKNQTVMNSSSSRMQKYQQLKDSSESKDSELKKVFTKEQYKLYQQRKEEMKEKMKQRIQEKRRNG